MKKGSTKTKTKSEAKPQTFGERLAGRLQSVAEALQSGEPLEKRLTVRTIQLDLEPKAYGPDDVKAVRENFGASQALMAKFLGVSAPTIRKWEQGQRAVPTMAARYMDDLQKFPVIWETRIKDHTKVKAK